MTDLAMRILMEAQQGNVLSVVNSVTDALKTGVGGALLGVGVAAAGLAIGLGVTAVNAARDYQSAMTQLQNTTGSSDAQMRDYKSTIRSLSDETGKSQTDLAKGMYQIISANFAGADATKILTTATKQAIIAHADQTQVTTGLVVTLNAFNLKASQADTVSNQMFKTLGLGRGNISDLAGALQTGAALVSHYGVSVTDMDATLATLSTGSMKTFGTSMTGLTQLLNVMDGKTDLVATRLHKMHIAFDEGKFKAMTYTQQVAYLNEAFKGHEKQMVAVLGSKQAAVALGILGDKAKLLTSNIKQLSDTQQLAKDKSDAWARTQGDFNQKMAVLGTRFQNVMIDIGSKLLPLLGAALDSVGTVISFLSATVLPPLAQAWKVLQDALTPIMPELRVLGIVLGVIVVGAIIVLVRALVSIIQIVSGVVATVLHIIVFFRDLFTGNFKALGSDLRGILDGIVEIFRGIFGGLVDQALHWGSNIINNIAQGIRNAIGNVGAAIGSVTQFISDHLPKSPAKIGPLRSLVIQGAQITEQLSQGMLSRQPRLQASMQSLLAPVANAPLASAGRSSTGGSGTVVNNYNFTLQFDGRSAKSDRELAEMVIQQASRQLQRSGNLISWTSGGRS